MPKYTISQLVCTLIDSSFEINIGQKAGVQFEVTHGRLEHYAALDAVSDYFKDKNLSRVLFDTLTNQLDIAKGVMSIPKMTINSSIGFVEISGKQNMNMEMEYYLRIPWKLVTQAAMSKLFGKKTQDDNPDEIQYRDESKRVRFINLKLTGTPDNYTIALGKDKNTYVVTGD